MYIGGSILGYFRGRNIAHLSAKIYLKVEQLRQFLRHADRGKAWARAAQDDLEDTYRETVVSGISMKLILVIGICGDPV